MVAHMIGVRLPIAGGWVLARFEILRQLPSRRMAVPTPAAL